MLGTPGLYSCWWMLFMMLRKDGLAGIPGQSQAAEPPTAASAPLMEAVLDTVPFSLPQCTSLTTHLSKAQQHSMSLRGSCLSTT